VPSEESKQPVTHGLWARVATDIERLTAENERLKNASAELERTCLQAFNQNELLKRLLRDHGIPIEEAL
jgi:hypothetical protein